MRAWIGKSLIIIGVIHNVGGIALYDAILGTLVSERIFNTITIFEGYDRQSAFWFLFAGFMLMIIGGLVNWFENHDQDMPKFVEWSVRSGCRFGARRRARLTMRAADRATARANRRFELALWSSGRRG